MKHVAITYPFPLGKPTGGARMTREIAAHLGARDIRVTLLPVSTVPHTRYPRPPVPMEGLGFEFDERLAAAGVNVRRVAPHFLHWALDGLAVRRALLDVHRSTPVDAVLSYYHEAAFLPVKGIRFGFISTWQSYALALDDHSPRRALWAALHKARNHVLVRAPHRRADVLFPTSEFTKNELASLLGVKPERMHVCYLGVKPEFLEIPRPTKRSGFNLIFFGRFVESKGVRDALSALGKARQMGLEDWRFRMFGQGDRAWVQGLAETYGVADKTEVLSAVGDDELLHQLAAADLALMPSHAEAFGLSIAEAQAAGLPVVAYRAGSVPEVVADGESGWLARFPDVDDLAACLAAALNDPAEVRRRGLAARERIAGLFTWENTAGVIAAGLEGIL